jgi:hypothetical protein
LEENLWRFFYRLFMVSVVVRNPVIKID